MFKEIISGKRDEESGIRRWYSSEKFDLYTWQNKRDEIQKFQICYKGRITALPSALEEVITWEADGGLQFDHVLGDGRISSPLLNEAQPFDVSEIRYELNDPDSQLDGVLLSFILDKLNEVSS